MIFLILGLLLFLGVDSFAMFRGARADVTAAVLWLAFVSLACIGKRPGRIKGFLKRPRLVASKLWAFGHLRANGDVAGMLLFGTFLAWAVVDRIAVKRRGDVAAPAMPRFTRADGVAQLAGSAAFVLMFWAHRYLIGVPVVLS
jgi:uncharacterized membrane protein